MARLEESLAEVAELSKQADWPLDPDRAEKLNENLDLVQSLTTELPSFLHRRIHDLAGEVRGRYRDADHPDLGDDAGGPGDVRLVRASVLSLGVSAACGC